MRHRVYGRGLGRDKNQRRALFKGLIKSLLISETINTTESKAKSVKGLIDKIINQAKNPSTKKLVSQFLTNKNITEKLFKDLVPRLGERNSGYTSVVRTGKRLGDGASMVRMSLLLSNHENSGKEKKERTTIPKSAK